MSELNNRCEHAGASVNGSLSRFMSSHDNYTRDLRQIVSRRRKKKTRQGEEGLTLTIHLSLNLSQSMIALLNFNSHP